MSQRNMAVPMAARDEACPINEVLDHIGGKWSIGIIVAAAAGPIRFTELERTVEGISRRMLTLNLRKLERDGLLVRTVYPTVPPKVEYSLTPIARELSESFATLTAWAERHRHAIAASRRQYDGQLGRRSGDLNSFSPNGRWCTILSPVRARPGAALNLTSAYPRHRAARCSPRPGRRARRPARGLGPRRLTALPPTTGSMPRYQG